MRDERKARLRMLLRRQTAREKRERLERFLGALSSTGWRVVAPPESDPLEERLFESVRSARRAGRLQSDERLNASELTAAVGRCLEGKPRGAPVVLATSRVSTIGIVEADLDLVRGHARAILDHDRDSLVIGDAEATWGLVCQRFEHPLGVTYQVESW